MSLRKYVSFTSNLLWLLNPLLVFIAFFKEALHLNSFFIWMGKMHPMLLHFPIVLGLLIAFYFLFMATPGLFFKALENAVILTNAVLASLVSILGILLSQQDSYSANLLRLHQWGGIGISLFSWLFYFLHNFNTVFQSKRSVRIFTSVLYVFIIIFFTHKGGQLTHGVNAISFPKTAMVEENTVIVSMVDSNALLYERAIQPILIQKCVSCHGEDKTKGDLKLNTPENILKGGKNGNILTAVEKGKAASLFERIHLPLSNEEHMPPDGKLQLTKHEIALLSNWIMEGGDLKIKMSQLLKTDSLFILANSYQPEKIRNIKENKAAPSLKEFNSNYCSVNYVYTGSTAIEVTFFQGIFYDQAQLKKLIKVKEQVVSLNLQGMPLEESDIKIISEFANLEKLNINYTQLDLKNIIPLKALKKLKSIAICGIEYKDAVLEQFLSKSNFTQVHIWSNKMNTKALEKLKLTYPAIQFIIGDNLEGTLVKISAPTIDQDASIIEQSLEVKIKHQLNGVILKYSIDGTTPDSLTGLAYTKPLRFNKNTNLKVKAFKPGWISSDVIQKTFYKSEIKPDTIYLITQPDNKYKGIGAKTMIDYELGAQNFSNGKWLGYKDSNLEFIIGFKSPRLLKQAYFNTFVDIGSYIFPIVSIQVAGSNDGKKFIPIANTQFPAPITNDIMKESKTFSIAFKAQTQYKLYKFIVVNVKKLPKWHPGVGTPGWIFIDELFLN